MGRNNRCGLKTERKKQEQNNDVKNSRKRNRIKNSPKFCDCGKQIKKGSMKCSKCHHENNRKIKNRPPYDILKNEVDLYGYSATGRKYGVSDNAIRKWLKK